MSHSVKGPAPAPVEHGQHQRRRRANSAAGYTNREIAKRLYITISTVEQYVKRFTLKGAVHDENVVLPSSDPGFDALGPWTECAWRSPRQVSH